MSKQGFSRGGNSGIAVTEFVALSEQMQHFVDEGYWEQVQSVLQVARGEIRDWIRADHPNPVFKDKNVQTYGGSIAINSQGKEYYADLSQFRLGHFGIIGKNNQSRGHAYNGAISSLNVYSNYYARWWATGSKGHKTSKGMSRGYPPHGNYYENKSETVSTKFAEFVESELQNTIKI